MKRLWMGLGILAVLLALGLGMIPVWEQVHGQTSRELNQAAVAGKSENWQEAGDHFRRAREGWQKSDHITAAVTDHKPMEEIAGEFIKLQVCLENRDKEDFIAGCLALAQQVENVKKAQGLTWWDFL